MTEIRRFYTTVQEMIGVTGTKNADDAYKTRMRGLIRQCSDTLETETDRRFDWRFDTIQHAAWLIADGGDLFDGYTVALRDELQAITGLTNAGTVITSDLYRLIKPVGGATAYYTRLTRTDENTWSRSAAIPAGQDIIIS